MVTNQKDPAMSDPPRHNHDPATSSKRYGSKARLEQIRRMQIVAELRAARALKAME